MATGPPNQRRKPGRGEERPADALPRIEKLDRLAVILGLGEVVDEGYVHDRWVRVHAALEQHVDGFARNPVGPLASDAFEALAITLDLAALHRQQDVGGGLIAADDLEFEPQQLVERFRIGAVPVPAPLSPTMSSVFIRS